MRRSFVQLLTGMALLGLAGAIFAYADSPGLVPAQTLTAEGKMTLRTRAVISGEYAYLLGTPETIVADSKIDKIVPSPSGDAILFAAYKRRPFRSVALPPTDNETLDELNELTELNLVYWDTRTRTARILLREAVNSDTATAIQKIEWLPQTRTALVVLNRVSLRNGQLKQMEESVLRVDTAASTVSRLTNRDPSADSGFYSGEDLVVSPDLPQAYLLLKEYPKDSRGATARASLRPYSSRGFGTPIPLPNGVGPLEWSPDGKSVYSEMIRERNAEGKTKIRKALTVINLETGEVTHPETLPAFAKTQRPKEAPSFRESWNIDVTAANATLQNPAGKSQPASTLWLQASPPQKKETTATANSRNAADALLIATNAQREGVLAAENSAAVLFTRDGSLCAAPLFRLTVEALATAMRGVQRTAAMSNAKQIGLALIGYIQDYDENFPPSGGATAEQIGAYVRNPDIFQNPATGENGFVFSYGGPSGLAQIDNVSTTKLGYVSGPGGRAIMWADGHVTWEDTP